MFFIYLHQNLGRSVIWTAKSRNTIWEALKILTLIGRDFFI